ncbi:geranylgeranylglyceryl/heptaprenylglyceryl phosphate synthase [Cohnella sp. CIP 111063]|jgi:putative glycerol-1-phosphate prenyltransferase|uniref:heptaprenylglyceryl phosphate synthase n=1 Tax=unclassified Cohnella TaxID=2636738 RepID=UPI000B8C24A8|nr:MULTISPECIES: heptaprenylglyceryl phosphate synthase [unclassified Cohnella]OXS55808.1 geranylgeranylglyceryl/heptaprenylglyceryl phosphate synthase [Cohnella sp. CIP 111063]PRX67001.1 putative glycerol-1-phosphate prenyltransferase [Cohnella sp. SGD-V74]
MRPSFYSGWKHVFKLDPDREIGDEALEAVCASGTDAILVGGSSGVTFDNTVELMSRIRRYEVPCAFELSDPACGVPGFDGYFIPSVLNAKRAEWLIGHHAAAIKDYGHLMPWESIVGEAYLVLNPDSTVARLTEADARIGPDEAVAYAQVADRLWNVPVLYVEYSGTFGDMELLGRIRAELRQAHLFYGGGIDGPEKAAQAALRADTVVVGNVIYDNLDAALTTVQAVNQAAKERNYVF